MFSRDDRLPDGNICHMDSGCTVEDYYFQQEEFDWDACSTSCISGEAEVVDVSTGPVRVADVVVGQRVRGVGEDLAAKTCEVLAVGSWGDGMVRGNYTL